MQKKQIMKLCPSFSRGLKMVRYPSGHKGADLKSVVSVNIRRVGSNPTRTAISILVYRKINAIVMYERYWGVY